MPYSKRWLLIKQREKTKKGDKFRGQTRTCLHLVSDSCTVFSSSSPDGFLFFIFQSEMMCLDEGERETRDGIEPTQSCSASHKNFPHHEKKKDGKITHQIKKRKEREKRDPLSYDDEEEKTSYDGRFSSSFLFHRSQADGGFCLHAHTYSFCEEMVWSNPREVIMIISFLGGSRERERKKNRKRFPFRYIAVWGDRLSSKVCSAFFSAFSLCDRPTWVGWE